MGNLTKVSVESEAAIAVANQILSLVMPYRRMLKPEAFCSTTCAECLAPHLSKVVAAVSQQRRIVFVLPAFPGKSPNLEKVLGHLPDMAEQQSLIFLNELCHRIERVYLPGAEIILCSDGRVFSDVVGMKEEAVTEYQNSIGEILESLSLNHLSMFTLDELGCDHNSTLVMDASHKNYLFSEVRRQLMETFGRPLESLREKVRRGGSGSTEPEDLESHRIFCGITRFLVEDASHLGQTKSRSAIQKDCRARAYEVILRSHAWSELIASRFPEAVRLSIHPQSCGSKKLGVQLLAWAGKNLGELPRAGKEQKIGGLALDGRTKLPAMANPWMTPWHGVAVDTGSGFLLMKRREAEQLGLTLIHDGNGRASHFASSAHKQIASIDSRSRRAIGARLENCP